jgi:hypothetical protein
MKVSNETISNIIKAAIKENIFDWIFSGAEELELDEVKFSKETLETIHAESKAETILETEEQSWWLDISLDEELKATTSIPVSREEREKIGVSERMDYDIFVEIDLASGELIDTDISVGS